MVPFTLYFPSAVKETIVTFLPIRREAAVRRSHDGAPTLPWDCPQGCLEESVGCQRDSSWRSFCDGGPSRKRPDCGAVVIANACSKQSCRLAVR